MEKNNEERVPLREELNSDVKMRKERDIKMKKKKNVKIKEREEKIM